MCDLDSDLCTGFVFLGIWILVWLVIGIVGVIKSKKESNK